MSRVTGFLADTNKHVELRHDGASHFVPGKGPVMRSSPFQTILAKDGMWTFGCKQNKEWDKSGTDSCKPTIERKRPGQGFGKAATRRSPASVEG